jgi:hypothetical protein
MDVSRTSLTTLFTRLFPRTMKPCPSGSHHPWSKHRQAIPDDLSHTTTSWFTIELASMSWLYPLVLIVFVHAQHLAVVAVNSGHVPSLLQETSDHFVTTIISLSSSWSPLTSPSNLKTTGAALHRHPEPPDLVVGVFPPMSLLLSVFYC